MEQIIIESSKVDGITNTTVLVPDSGKFVKFQTIDTIIDDEKLIDTLGIIRGDIYNVCKGVNDKFIIISDWKKENVLESLKVFVDYARQTSISSDTTPIFFICALDFEYIEDYISILCRGGFETANHLVDLENNIVFILTSKQNHKRLCKNVFNR